MKVQEAETVGPLRMTWLRESDLPKERWDQVV
jgi:hypothetical protein